MSDLVERLRKMNLACLGADCAIYAEAADRITALEKENAQLRGDMMEIQKKAMWLRGEQAYREFPRYVIRAVDLSIRRIKPSEAEGREATNDSP